MDFSQVSLSGFSFVLLIIAVGYVCIESQGKHYIYEKSITKYSSGLERILHYFLRGLLVNILTIYLSKGVIDQLFKLFDQAGEISISLSQLIHIENILSLQVYIFVISYSFPVLLIAYLVGKILMLCRKYISFKKK